MHKRFKLCDFFLLLFLLLTGIAWSADLYRLGPGDNLLITVWERPEFKTEVIVGPDGRIAIPLAGQLDVNNLTLTEVETEIAHRFEPYIREPLVTVQIIKYRTFRVQILGQVAKPGFYNLEAGSTLLDALAIAGGPLPTADLNNVQLGSEQVNVVQILKDPKLDKKLTSGETINVLGARPVLILGAVKNPGTYYQKEEQTVLDVIALAGGLTASADENNIWINREGTVLESHLAELSENAVQPGDVITVAEKKQVVIAGKVVRPGAYQIKDGMSVADVIALAGGLLSEASNTVTVFKSGTSYETVTKARDPLQGGESLFIDIAKDMVLILGEVAKPGQYTYSQAQTLLSALALAGGPTNNASLKEVTINDKLTDVLEIIANPQKDIDLSIGTTVYVPQKSPVIVLGLVKNPGSIIPSEGQTILEMIALSGGLTERADPERISLKRENKVFEGSLAELGTKKVEFGDTITVLEKRQVVVAGKVAKPGLYEFKAGLTVSDALALAGGLLNDAANTISLFRDGQTYQVLANSRELLLGGESLFVGTSSEIIIVLGEVAKPGSYNYQDGQTILSALALAGGPKETANLQAVLIGEKKVDLQSIFADNNKDMTISSGTTIYIPQKSPVLVLGAVRNPGSLTLKEGQTLLEVIALCGGLSTKADENKIRLERENEVYEGTLTDLGTKVVKLGDKIFIPEIKEIIIAGRVTRPGLYDLKKSLTVLDAIALAGGLLPDAAKTVTLIKDGQSREVDINSKELLAGGESLFIGASNQRIVVLGMVARPGSYNWQEGFSVRDALAMAGGYTDRSDLGKAVIIRDGVKKQVDWSQNELLFGGDILEIPEWQKEVLIMGEVSHPGLYTIARGQKLLDIIGLAGGLTDKAEYEISLRTKEQFINLSIAKAIEDPADVSNLTLAGGEVILVPEAKNEILVFGQVQKPGRYSYKQGDDLATLIALAGGVTNKADLTKIEIKRGEEVNYAPLGNYPLYGNETILVRETQPITVLGEVEKPGSFSVVPTGKLVELIAMAGGPTKFTDLAKVKIYRGGEPSAETMISVGSGKLVFEGRASENPEVYPGDVIYVARGKKLDPTEIAAYLSIVSSLSNLLKAWF